MSNLNTTIKVRISDEMKDKLGEVVNTLNEMNGSKMIDESKLIRHLLGVGLEEIESIIHRVKNGEINELRELRVYLGKNNKGVK